MTRTSRMLNYINYRMKVTLKDKRTLVGSFLAFDKHMNIVLADCEEFRTLKARSSDGEGIEEREERRTLGLVLLRGENIVSLVVESPPPSDASRSSKKAGPGVAMSVGRGMPTMMRPLGMSSGLTGPVSGIGGPSSFQMQPNMGMPPPPPPGNFGTK